MTLQAFMPDTTEDTEPPMPGREEALFRKGVFALLQEAEQRRRNEQNEVPTAFDKALWQLAILLAKLDPATPWEESCRAVPGSEGANAREALAVLKGLVERSADGRYADYRDRLANGGCDVTPPRFAMSSGVNRSISWKGRALFKTAFDVALYPMLLWEMKPSLIVEIGSGTGTSAIWLADLARSQAITCEVITFDCQDLRIDHRGVRFVRGDCRTFADDFDLQPLRDNSGPTLVIEDAHVNVSGVLEHLDAALKPGDYVIVEDSLAKQDVLLEWTSRVRDRYRVDTHLVDFFGHNLTSARDSIFMRMH